MHRLFATALALAASAPSWAQEQQIRLSIAPGKAGEVCMALDKGDTLAWHFKSSHAADFNLHHHVAKEVLMPVERKAVTEDRAQFTADRRNEWCLMWTAPTGQGLTVTGGWSVAASKPPPK
jgi:hypothetical protein